MSTTSTTLGRLAEHRRIPAAGIFAEVDHVDATGAPVLAAGARDLGICENELPGHTRVAVYGYRSGGKAEGYITTVTLTVALADTGHGVLKRIGPRAFEIITVAPAIGPGLTGGQKRRRHLAKAAR